MRIVGDQEKVHYKKILTGAKTGQFGGKKYKQRMYQVLRSEIIEYADTLKETEQMKLFQIEPTPTIPPLNVVETPYNTTLIKKCYHHLVFLHRHNILTDTELESYKQRLVI